MDISNITDLIMAYASGDFSQKGEVSDRRDEMDTIVTGINMLGEELESTMISRDYFSSLYDAVTDMVFVLDNLGEIEDFNKAVSNMLNVSALSLKGTPIDNFIRIDRGLISVLVRKSLAKGIRSMEMEGYLRLPNQEIIPVSITASEVYRKTRFRSGYLLILKDIRKEKEQESLILRTIVETQESERRRVADDLHDSLGQKLSAVKFYINALGNHVSDNPASEKAIKNAKMLLNDSIQDLRDIVFAQMPITLEKFGISKAVDELMLRIDTGSGIDFHVEIADNLPEIEKNLQVVIYRIIQEFIQNTLKHAEASNVYIDILMKRKQLMLRLEDDGVGFDTVRIPEFTGRGLRNMLTRARAFHGEHQLKSGPGKGVMLSVLFPLTNLNTNPHA